MGEHVVGRQYFFVTKVSDLFKFPDWANALCALLSQPFKQDGFLNVQAILCLV